MSWMPARIAAAASVLAALVLAGCATSSVYAEPPAPLPSPTQTIVQGKAPADGHAFPGSFVVRYDATELHLAPVSYCFTQGLSGVCADGVDENPPSIGDPAELFVFVPQAGFDRLQVSQVGGGDYCTGRSVDASVTDLGAGWWSVRPSGPAGEHHVDLFASGQGAGDMSASLTWSTPADAPLPAASATLALVVDHDGKPDSYGVELSVRDLPATPETYSATITTTASNGRSSTFQATPADCAGEGSLYFDGPDSGGTTAAALGDFPFTYSVGLTLDGTTYIGTATYPDDLPRATEIAVPLVFTPALP